MIIGCENGKFVNNLLVSNIHFGDEEMETYMPFPSTNKEPLGDLTRFYILDSFPSKLRPINMDMEDVISGLHLGDIKLSA